MLSKYFSNPKDKEDFAIAVVVIALAGLLIGYFTFYQDKSVFDGIGTLVTQNTNIDTLEVDGMTYVSVATEDEELPDPNIHKSKIVPVAPINTTLSTDTLAGKNTDLEDETINSDDNDSTMDGTDLDDVGVADSTKDLLDSVISSDGDVITEDEPLVVEEDNGDAVNEEVITEKPEVITEEPKQAETPAPTKEKPNNAPKSSQKSKCIVVIGAYGNQTNIRKLIGKLDQEGYPVFKVPYRGFTRVGAYIDCEYSTSLLEKIRRDYSADAFLMKAK